MPASDDKLNQFELLEPLGKGAWVRSSSPRTRRSTAKVAIKFLTEPLKEDPIARERFLRESKLAAAPLTALLYAQQ